MILSDVDQWCVEKEGFSQSALLFGKGSKALKLLSLDNPQIDACLRAVMQENEIDDFTSSGWTPEGSVGNSKGSFYIGDLLLDDMD